MGGQGLLIDTGPDQRQQALREGIRQVDAVLYTHPHADHLNGIDDLRAFCYVKKGPITLYGNAFTLDNIKTRFDYALLPPSKMWDKPVLLPQQVDGPVDCGGVTLTPVPCNTVPGLPGLARRRHGLADRCVRYPGQQPALVAGLKLLFLDCLNHDPYPSHLGVQQSFAWAKRIGAERTVLIHMTHRLEFGALSAECPPGIEVGHDGLRIELPFS